MGGKFSRKKGIRAELMLVHHLRSLGLTANRVPLSGASGTLHNKEEYKHDVVASDGDNTYTFEMKSRRATFDKIYAVFHQYSVGGRLRFSIGDVCVEVAKDLTRITETNRDSVYFPDCLLIQADHLKTFRQIVKLKELKKTSDFLVIKSDRMPLLFLRYYE